MRLFILFFSFISVISVNAQRNCTAIINSAMPVISSQSNSMSPEKIITIPVVVHVVYNNAVENISEAQIISQITSLNADFTKSNNDFSKVPSVFAKLAANTSIRFELAKTDPMGKSTTGIIRKKSTRMMWTDDDKIKYQANGGSTTWDAKSYLNIWVCNTVPGLTGYASFPGADRAVDGIVIRYDAFGTVGKVLAPFNLGRTLTHEVGHWMGLKHLWGDQQCGDDGIGDTPKQRNGNSGTPVFPKTDGKRSSMLNSKALAPAWNNNMEPEILTVNTRDIVVYPNPVQSGNIKLLVNTNLGSNGKNYAIISSNGQIVKTGHLLEMEEDINVQSLAPGIYQIRLTDIASNSSTKFVKQ
ncbi:MAG: zinc-dependent metalloprotease [Chitinophagaceae bacterium]|nr:zinc-dependent metalloprotease [Chitinophagaceae bacterium]